MKKKNNTPVYKSLADKLCEQIAEKKLSDGDFFSTIKDISKQYNVAVLTVRRAVEVLQNNGIIFCKSACGIFVKSTVALDTVRARKNFILVIDDHTSGAIMASYWAMRLCSILEFFSDTGFSVKISNSSEINEKDLFSMQHLISGMIISSSKANKYAAFINDKSSPPITFTRQPSIKFTSTKLSYPLYDNKKVFQMGRDYFVRNKKKNLIIINFNNSGFSSPPADIFGGHISVREIKSDTIPSVQAGLDIAATLQFDNETGIWLHDDFTALGVYNYFLSRGRNLFAENALLATAGPTVGMTEELGLPVIGFCPWESGKAIANCLLTTINKKKLPYPVITPSSNKNI